MANELMKAGDFKIAKVEEDVAEMIREEMRGLGTVAFDNVKIPAGGGLAFEVPGDDPENPDVEKEITCVILAHVPVNVFFEKDYDGEAVTPDCVAYDGTTGYNANTGEITSCKECPFNQFGSGKNGGKACQNRHELYILREGQPLPLRLTLPATSLKNFKEYMFKRVLMKNKKLHNVVTKITLKKAQNSGGIAYSQACFAPGGDLSEEQVKALQGSVKLVESVLSERKAKAALTEIDNELSPFED